MCIWCKVHFKLPKIEAPQPHLWIDERGTTPKLALTEPPPERATERGARGPGSQSWWQQHTVDTTDSQCETLEVAV